MRLYEYTNCSTCRSAVKFLERKGVAFTRIPIRDTPPSIKELKAMLQHLDGDERRLFNTSGADYRALNLKEVLRDLSLREKLALLHGNGNLIKRPFLIADEFGVTGFKEKEWARLIR